MRDAYSAWGFGCSKLEEREDEHAQCVAVASAKAAQVWRQCGVQVCLVLLTDWQKAVMDAASQSLYKQTDKYRYSQVEI